MNIRIYDNEGQTFDRYTVVYMDDPITDKTYSARGMSERPFHPLGFGQWCEAMVGKHLGKEITFEELPAQCQELVQQDIQLLKN